MEPYVRIEEEGFEKFYVALHGGGGFEKFYVALHGGGGFKNCQNHPYVINEWPLN